jgi:hypothetical protein
VDLQPIQNWPWTAIATVTAVLALVLNQLLPPLRLVLKRRKLRLGVADYVVLSHVLGDMRLGLHIDIHNTGGYGVVVQRIKCLVVGPKREHGSDLIGFRYSTTSNDTRALGEILVKYDDQWSGDVILWGWQPENEIAEANAVMAALRANWNERLALESALAKLNPLIEDTQAHRAELARLHEEKEATVQAAMRFFQEHFGLVEGSYSLVVGIISDDDRLMDIRACSFTLFPNHIEQLKEVTKNYERADFSEWNPPQVTVRMRREDHQQARRKYEQRILDG